MLISLNLVQGDNNKEGSTQNESRAFQINVCGKNIDVFVDFS